MGNVFAIKTIPSSSQLQTKDSVLHFGQFCIAIILLKNLNRRFIFID
jgi:hypothetical protein